MKELQTTFEITEQDFIQFYLNKNWSGDHKKNYRLMMQILFIIFYLGAFSFVWESPLLSVKNVFLLIIGVCAFIYFPTLVKNNHINAARNQYRQLYPESLIHTLTVTPNLIKMENKNGSSESEMKHVLKLEELEELFVIYLDKQTAILLSQETFLTRQEYDEFVDKTGEWLLAAKG